MPNDARYWFAPKRYGWGWGMPISWQGWVVMALFFVLLLAGAAFLLPQNKPITFVAYSAALSVALIAVCRRKGPPPRWRWGDNEDQPQ